MKLVFRGEIFSLQNFIQTTNHLSLRLCVSEVAYITCRDL
jgi:hypothetical protein